MAADIAEADTVAVVPVQADVEEAAAVEAVVSTETAVSTEVAVNTEAVFLFLEFSESDCMAASYNPVSKNKNKNFDFSKYLK